MTRENTDTCASCEKFSIRDALDNSGRALCSGFEREMKYSDRACVLYIRDRNNIDARRRAVKRLMESETK